MGAVWLGNSTGFPAFLTHSLDRLATEDPIKLANANNGLKMVRIAEANVNPIRSPDVAMLFTQASTRVFDAFFGL